ncbi:PLANT INVERTASE/PECTIN METHYLESTERASE INHIBITOR SUPERFAMILY PROTEIN [Salix purpurea]|uniref:PLANT INVERTASE/PECTIN METHYLESTERASE INHIBITOR SUPERFAMILY PROTEIN n=1 Tax=Salix purpurea TaxID=77065 RepID=A0A9Q0WBC5_SALPP|nr:PLANT INVERTASE/PECTIN METHYLESTERASE INHIBITOR SUPERFAMILY PROTEIN [Salix purpurea]
MYSLAHRFMLLLTILMVLVSRSNAANAPSKLIQDICKETAESQGTYDGCVGALELDPTADSADISKLAEISLRLGISNTTDTQNYIRKLIKDATPEAQKTLSTCLSSYVAATASFKSALSELSEDPLSANYDSRVAGDDVQECEDELARDKARFPGLTARNNYGKLYSAIAFVVTNHLPQS